MVSARNATAISHPPRQVRALGGAVDVITGGIEPLVDLSRPYIDGLDSLPRDSRFLLVGDHTNFAVEATLIPHAVRREIDTRVRPLAGRSLADIPRPLGDLLAAYGAVIGDRENARELMRLNETILVFPGGAREVPNFKGEADSLHWQDRFAEPIDTGKPAGIGTDKWVAASKQKVQRSLAAAMADLREIRSQDPYRRLNPLAWRRAVRA